MVGSFNLRGAQKRLCGFCLKLLNITGISVTAQTHSPHSGFYHVVKMVIWEKRPEIILSEKAVAPAHEMKTGTARYGSIHTGHLGEKTPCGTLRIRMWCTAPASPDTCRCSRSCPFSSSWPLIGAADGRGRAFTVVAAILT